jgi:NitT/TauT family transport system substrate-binding protein
MGRSSARVTVLGIALLIAGCSAGSGPPAPPKQADKVTYVTAFGAVGRDAFAWVAKDKGYFQNAGLDVTIQNGAAAGENLKVLSGGQAQFAALDQVGAWILAGQGTYRDFRTIAVIHQQTLVSIIALEGHGVTAPKDLEGRTLAAATGGVNQLLFPAYAAAAGVDAKKVKVVNSAPAQLTALLVGGKVDALSTFLLGRTGIEKAANAKAVVLPYSQYLKNLLGNGIVTSAKLAKENPGLASRFRDAALKGLRYTIEHPQEAAQLLKKAQPSADVDAAVGEITAMTAAVTPDNGAPIGSTDEARVQKVIETLVSAGLMPAGLKPSDVVDFGLIPKP